MGDRVGVELLYNWVELGAKVVASRIPDSKRPDVVGKPRSTEGALGKPLMEWTPTSREQERHNVTVISSGGQNMKFMFGLQHPLTCISWTTLSNPCNKVRGKYVVKEVFLCLPSCVVYSCVFLRASVFIIIES